MKYFLICLLLLCVQGLLSGEELSLDTWLAAGPLKLPSLAFEEADGEQLLDEPLLDIGELEPEEGASIPWFQGSPGIWRQEQALEEGLLFTGSPDGLRAAYLAGYMEVQHRTTVEIEVSSRYPLALYCNGEKKASGKSAADAASDPVKTSVKLDLVTGKHCVVIKTVSLPGKNLGDWFVKASAPGGGLEWSLDPKRSFARIDEMRAMNGVSALALSPDGTRLAMQLSRSKPHRSTWITIRSLAGEEPDIDVRLGTSVNTPRWSPDGEKLAFRSGTSIWTYEVETGRYEEVLHKEGDLQRFFWAPDSRSIYFMTHGKKKADSDYVRLWDPRDRLTDWDETVQLNRITLEGGLRKRLTAKGEFALTQAAPSPDGKQLALVKRIAVTDRPFFESQFWLMDLESGETALETKLLFPFENGPANLTWSPDGRKIAFTAPPGETKAGGEEHNAFDTCLYVLDLETSTMDRLSDRFGEAVASGLTWREEDGRIYFIAQYRAFRRIAHIDPAGEGGLEFLQDEPSVVSLISLSGGSSKLAYAGTSLDTPVRVYLMDCEDRTSSLLLDPNKTFMEKRELGPWERFDYENPEGDLINGWLLYPPRFDEKKKWPMIVYYYGGVSPQQERFSVLYYHWLAANGYVLYVVNPSGAVGYGHDFADKHCNDWGRTAGRDIINGVENVIKTKPFIDSKRIGGYGGSYGGFMTLSLITECDLFRAACSMYGISNLASYWGAGIWGYTYGDTAMAGSYPWTRRDVFVDRSPLFHADQINAALLLLHGEDDTNVPAVESEQLFTALKVLNKEVAYVRFPGENHGIAGKPGNLEAHRSMILEWFDKHLKDQPEGWEARWKK